MGNNIDLCELLGLPYEIICPKCQKQMRSYFDGYDIKCGDPNAKDGWMYLDCYCRNCETNFEYEVLVV